MILSLFPSWLWHPLGQCLGNANTVKLCRGYNFWSGVGSDIGEITLILGLVSFALAWWHHHNCGVHRCWRVSFHPHPDHGVPVCRRHHPNHPIKSDKGSTP